MVTIQSSVKFIFLKLNNNYKQTNKINAVHQLYNTHKQHFALSLYLVYNLLHIYILSLP